MRPSDTLPPSPVPGLPGPVPGAGPGWASSSTRGSSAVSFVACRLGPRSPGLGEEAGGSGVVSSGEEGRQPAGAGDGVRVMVGAVSKGGGIPPPGRTQHFAPTLGREPRGGETSPFCLLLSEGSVVCFLFGLFAF